MSARGWVVAIALACGALGGAFVAGQRGERRAAANQARNDALQHNAEALRLSASLADAQRRATRAELSRDSIARTRYVVARAKVRIVSDSQVAIVATHDSAGIAVVDSVNPTIEIPKEVIATLAAAEAAVRQDSVTLMAQAAELQTLYRRDSLHAEREHLLEQQLAETRPQRCGRRCGFVAGVTATTTVVLAVTHPAETFQLAGKVGRWIVHRF